MIRFSIFAFLVIFFINKQVQGQNYYNGQLGTGKNYFWTSSVEEVNMAMLTPEPIVAKIPTETQTVAIDIHRTALIIIDMQNDFCTEGGWVDSLGLDYNKARVAIEPLVKLVPEARKAGIKIIWVNWGIRMDLHNMPPTLLWQSVVLNETMGYGKPNKYGSNILEKGSWGAEVVEELRSVTDYAEDVKIDKFRYSGFWDTPLDSILKNFGIKTIMFTGVNTDQCVYHSLADAHFLGYGSILVRDGCSSVSPQYVVDATFWQVSQSFGWITNSTNIINAITNVNN